PGWVAAPLGGRRVAILHGITDLDQRQEPLAEPGHAVGGQAGGEIGVDGRDGGPDGGGGRPAPIGDLEPAGRRGGEVAPLHEGVEQAHDGWLAAAELPHQAVDRSAVVGHAAQDEGAVAGHVVEAGLDQPVADGPAVGAARRPEEGGKDDLVVAVFAHGDDPSQALATGLVGVVPVVMAAAAARAGIPSMASSSTIEMSLTLTCSSAPFSFTPSSSMIMQ